MKLRIGTASEWVEVEHYSRATEDYLERLAPKSIVLSGNSTPWEHYDREELEGTVAWNVWWTSTVSHGLWRCS